MLVLSRKIGESVIIGGGIEVTLISIDRGKARLGFKAPADIEVLREELVGCKSKGKRRQGQRGSAVTGAANDSNGRSSAGCAAVADMGAASVDTGAH